MIEIPEESIKVKSIDGIDCIVILDHNLAKDELELVRLEILENQEKADLWFKLLKSSGCKDEEELGKTIIRIIDENIIMKKIMVKIQEGNK